MYLLLIERASWDKNADETRTACRGCKRELHGTNERVKPSMAPMDLRVDGVDQMLST